MSTYKNFKAVFIPRKWAPPIGLGSYFTFSNYRRVWLTVIISLAITCLVPLSIITVIHQRMVDKAMNVERILRIERVTSNARRSIGNFLEERMDALKFTVNEVAYEKLSRNEQLENVLKNLKIGFGGLSDLGVINSDGTQVAYIGQFNLIGKNYTNELWFKECVAQGQYISDVFKGFRGVPHIVLSVKALRPDGNFFILRATLDTAKLMETVRSYQSSEYADIFLINHAGILQTPSAAYGEVLQKVQFDTPEYSQHSQAVEIPDINGRPLVLGYAYIMAGTGQTPFILINLKQNSKTVTFWDISKRHAIRIFCASVFVIVLIIMLISTYMINRLYISDSIKANTLKAAEHKTQLASIGQLAAGVAHEINNPLAVINEDAGYLMDLMSMNDGCVEKAELDEHIKSILDSVERCGGITRQLLYFARQFDVKIMAFHPADVLGDVLKFYKKEAEYRDITVNFDVGYGTPQIVSDKGKFQQIFVNLVNNAFQAMGDKGRLDIHLKPVDKKGVSITVRDDGCGISEENLSRIYDPFFTTKGEHEGTGLGLSITYGLVQNLKGKINVKSRLDRGTTFSLFFPVDIDHGKKDN